MHCRLPFNPGFTLSARSKGLRDRKRRRSVWWECLVEAHPRAWWEPTRDPDALSPAEPTPRAGYGPANRLTLLLL